MTTFNSLLDRASEHMDGSCTPMDVAFTSADLDAYLDTMREGRTDDPNDPANWSSAELLELLDESATVLFVDDSEAIRNGAYTVEDLLRGFSYIARAPRWLRDRYPECFANMALETAREFDLQTVKPIA